MRCLVFAYSEIGVVSLQTLLDLGQDVVGVVTHKDNPAESRWYRSVEEFALKHDIAVISPEDPNTPEVLSWAQARRADIVFSFYYRKMLKEPLLKLGRLGAYNMHGSLLPKFRGRAPVNWAIIEGATETGLTLHEMLIKPDAGDILGQEAVPIYEQDTARDVFDKLVPMADRILRQVVPLLAEGTAPRKPQNNAEATYFGARTPEDGRLDWTWPSVRIHNMVRALTRPYPGAFTLLGGKKLYVWKGAIGKSPSPGQPGQVLPATTDGVPVTTGDGLYIVKQVGWNPDSSLHAYEVLAHKDKVLMLGIS